MGKTFFTFEKRFRNVLSLYIRNSSQRDLNLNHMKTSICERNLH
jgi:hypothetical protein